MEKYTVTITDTMAATREISANSPEEAEELIRKEYNLGNIELDYENYGDTEFKAETVR